MKYLLPLLAALLAGAACASDPTESDVTLLGNIVVTPDPVPAGGEIVVRYQIKNQGAAATSGGFTTRVLLKNQFEFQFLQLDFPVPAMAAGQIVSEAHHITLPGDLFSGTYSVRLRLDPFFDIANEGDNSNDASDPFPFTVVSVLPDLKVTSAEVCPHSAHAGDAVKLKFTILNDSGSPASASRNRVELIDPKSNQPVFVSYMTNGVIAAHAALDQEFPFVVPAGGLPGRWDVSVFLNDFQDFPESNTFDDVYDPLVVLQVVAAGTAVEPCVDPIRLAGPRWAAGKLALDVTGPAGTTVTVQVSTDLRKWAAAGTVTLAGGKGSYNVPTGNGGYFRAVK